MAQPFQRSVCWLRTISVDNFVENPLQKWPQTAWRLVSDRMMTN